MNHNSNGAILNQQKNERLHPKFRQARLNRVSLNGYICSDYLPSALYRSRAMIVLKAKFKDEAGFYTMIWSYNPDLWSAKDLLAHECSKSNSQLIEILSNAN